MNSGSGDIGELLLSAIRSEVCQIHTSIPGKIRSYDSVTQTATVQPAVRGRRRLEDGTIESYQFQEIPGVPVEFPGAGDYRITWPLQAGDEVILDICERSIDQWQDGGADDNEPADPRRFDLSDAIARPAPTSSAGRTVQVMANGMVISVGAGKTLYLGDKTATDFVALAGLVKDEIKALRDWAAAHKHAGVTTGSGTSAIPDPPPIVGSVAATKVKAK